MLELSANREEVAYQLYKALGKERTYARVAELMGKSEKTIRDYGIRGKWQDRLDADFLLKAEEINKKREELEYLGFEVAIAAMKKIKEHVENKGLSKELAQIYETFLSCPLSVIGQTGSLEEQSAGATSICSTDTQETKDVIKQIDDSLAALGGEENG